MPFEAVGPNPKKLSQVTFMITDPQKQSKTNKMIPYSFTDISESDLWRLSHFAPTDDPDEPEPSHPLEDSSRLSTQSLAPQVQLSPLATR